MKKVLSALLVAVTAVLLVGCSPTIEGEAGLIGKARQELPVSDAETIELNYVGCHEKDDSALFWFVSGNEYQAHYYLALECEIVGEDEYKFVHTYEPVRRGMDIAALIWKRGYAFLVNNPECTTIRITDAGGTRDVQIPEGEYPFILYNELIPTEYLFLDKDGNQIP